MLYDKLDLLSKYIGISTNVPYPISAVQTAILDHYMDEKKTKVHGITYIAHEHFLEVRGALEKVQLVLDPPNDKVMAHIHYKSGDVYCWERLSKCKELCQIVIRTPDTMNTNYTHLRDFFFSLTASYASAPNERAKETKAIDELGLLAALEILFPMELRFKFMPRIGLPDTSARLRRLIQQQTPKEEMPGTKPREEPAPDADNYELLAFLFRIPTIHVRRMMNPERAPSLLDWAKTDNPGRYGTLKLPIG